MILLAYAHERADTESFKLSEAQGPSLSSSYTEVVLKYDAHMLSVMLTAKRSPAAPLLPLLLRLDGSFGRPLP
jgi:hypothetical protein